ncbi:MAG TPA: hypothetical protein VHD57_13040 [Vicinamibacterales bacterium]|jgi:hypothetical protein|nr:hypothetical protein [Vicinamibacterales bacterium]
MDDWLAAILAGLVGAVLAVAAWVIGWIVVVRADGGGLGAVGFEIDQLLEIALVGFVIGAAWTLRGRRAAR